MSDSLDDTRPLSDPPHGDSPDTEIPDTEIPDTEIPDTDSPDTDSPDTDSPDTDSPDTDSPVGPDSDDAFSSLPEDHESAAAGPDFAAPAQPRLSIGHIMLWTVGSAVLLAANQFLQTSEDQRTASMTQQLQWQLGVFSITYGMGVASLALWMWRRITGGVRFPVQPGHWLLVVTGVSGLLMVVSLAMANWQMTVDVYWRWQEWMWIVAQLALQTIPSVLMLVALMSIREKEKRWKVFFVLRALSGFVAAAAMATIFIVGSVNAVWLAMVMFLPMYLQWFLTLAVFVAVVTAIVIDLHSGRRRDWLHWVGVVVEASSYVLGVVVIVVWAVLQWQ